MPEMQRPPWWPTPLTWVFLAILAFDLAVLLLAFHTGSTGSDAAGNAMGSAFRRAFVGLGAIAVGVIALLFLVIPYRTSRIVMTVLLGLVSSVLPVLL